MSEEDDELSDRRAMPPGGEPPGSKKKPPPGLENVNGDLTLRGAQAAADASVMALGGYWPPLANLARLMEECGEVARVVNQLHGPKLRKPGEAAPDAAEELGDALYVLLVLANSLGVDMETALRDVLAKYERRDMPQAGE